MTTPDWKIEFAHSEHDPKLNFAEPNVPATLIFSIQWTVTTVATKKHIGLI